MQQPLFEYSIHVHALSKNIVCLFGETVFPRILFYKIRVH
jgi:hypothetical protein